MTEQGDVGGLGISTERRHVGRRVRAQSREEGTIVGRRKRGPPFVKLPSSVNTEYTNKQETQIVSTLDLGLPLKRCDTSRTPKEWVE